VTRHWANLEYGCSASLSEVSLPYWNQDEEWGGFGGPHAMVVGGFDATLKGLAARLGDKLRLSCPVSSIDYSAAEQQAAGDGDAADGTTEQQQQQQIKVTLASGEVLHASLVLVTVPLGVLQQGGVDFVPPLPDWKAAAAKKLGFGDLNKVVMQVRACGCAWVWLPAVREAQHTVSGTRVELLAAECMMSLG
jgi:lysine-specific histone demethylase 1